MVEVIGDQIEAMVDPALVDGCSDPDRKLPVGSGGFCEVIRHQTRDAVEPYDALPTQAELATLQRVPAKIPWRGRLCWAG
jgi:POT family proton-dependent oligopeptide transporter